MASSGNPYPTPYPYPSPTPNPTPNPSPTPAVGSNYIATGNFHTCAINSSQGVSCWGSNDEWQLGNDTVSSSDVPMTVDSLVGTPIKVVAGYYHSCALMASGSVQCWGYNGEGQLGNGSYDNSYTPVVSNLGGTAVDIAALSFSTCAVLSNGAVQCWGYNSYGQLGNGSTSTSNTPVYVSLQQGSQAISITGGYGTACALLSTGQVDCWGDNAEGQLGDNSTSASSTPVMVHNLGAGSGTTLVTSGALHVCALVNGTIMCWGYNGSGQLGIGNTTTQLIPVAVNLSGVQSVRASGYDTAAIVSSGVTYVWGDNTYGEIGNGTTSTTPVSSPELSGAQNLVALSNSPGDSDLCGLTSSKTILCWGYNTDGELGDDSTQNSSTPVSVYEFTAY
jgi:alpha-tubulin suppressor-like RCC1 family protein